MYYTKNDKYPYPSRTTLRSSLFSCNLKMDAAATSKRLETGAPKALHHRSSATK
jgi:hypothetical protein